MKKGLYNFAKDKLELNRNGGKFKLSVSFQQLHDDYGFGNIVFEGKNKYLVFNSDHRIDLIRDVLKEHKLDLTSDEYSSEKSRTENAENHRTEKLNSYPVSKDFILINTLTEFHLNGEIFAKSPLTSLGHYIKADEITSIEHPQIILVENLTLMANLAELNMPATLKNALWLYRGDLKPQQQTGSAYQFFRRFCMQNSMQDSQSLNNVNDKSKLKPEMICFSDFDPKGIEIALTCGADYWLTVEDDNVINIELEGSEKDWFDQANAKTYLENQTQLPDKCQQAFNAMNLSQKTLKQEHMLSHKIALTLFKL